MVPVLVRPRTKRHRLDLLNDRMMPVYSLAEM